METAVRLTDKFNAFADYWSPKIVGELNDSHVLLAKLHGEFVWHSHADQDELFLVVKGNLLIKLRDRAVQVNEGEFFIVPKGVEHCPVAVDEVQVILIEPQTTKHTGDLMTEKTVTTYERI